ncbi:MAG TPA: DUF1223 domain-containing protein [Alphaproteobacteria bacterium]
MNRIWIAAALALLGSDAAPMRAAAADAAAPVVVELFTSQGCSSCPPADAFLGELAQRRDVIALAFHIDYWDYIGWKDPFASPDFTKRQRGYAGALGLRSVYTPQMVIDGRVDAVGSHRTRVEELIRKSSFVSKLAATLEPAAGRAKLILPEARLERPATIWLAIYDREERTKVKRGENAGHTLSDYNIVRALREVATWDGRAQALEIDLADAAADGMGGAILIQSEGQGPIIGAVEVPVPADPVPAQ